MASKVIIFDTSKQQIGNPGSNLKKFVKKYKEAYKIGLNKQSLDYEKVRKANLLVVAGPKEKFNQQQITDLKKLVQTGGKLLILANEGGDRKNTTNLNSITQHFGISINPDCVIRTSFYKYFHPKQAYVHNGILNQQVTRVINGYSKQPKNRHNNMFMLGGRADDEDQQYQKESKRMGADFVYAHGATLNLKSPLAYPILTSGPLTYPSNKPICAVHLNKSGGRLMVCGSINMFNDDYFESEENQKIMDFIVKFFLTDQVQFEFTKDDNYQNPEFSQIPDIAEIADNLKSCFHEGQEIPKDFTTMFECELFKYDFDHVPEIVKLFAKMQIKHQPLALIVPQFQTPLLGLAPGVFPPVLKELNNPSLQLFDLDDQFSQEKVRLAQLTNKCQDSDLQYFVRQGGDILGITDKIKNRSEPKAIIRYLVEQIINFKKSNMG